jgi:hypothetical protein
MSRAQLLIVVIILAVAAGAAFLVLSPKGPVPPPEVVMSGSEFAKEYDQYKVSIPPDTLPGGYYDFPSLHPGDILRVQDRITELNYSARTRATMVSLSGFEGSPKLRDGLFFAGNLTGRYKVGDQVELTFHVVQTTVNLGSDSVPIVAELLDELNGKAREKSPDGIPAAAIRKYG